MYAYRCSIGYSFIIFFNTLKGDVEMTVKELSNVLKKLEQDKIIICSDEDGGWDNILKVKENVDCYSIVFDCDRSFNKKDF